MLRPAGISGDELRLYGDHNMQFTWLPWDYSDVLRVGGSDPLPTTIWGYAGGTGTVQNFLFNLPMVSYYAGDLLNVLNNVMSTSNMNAWIDEMGSAATSLKNPSSQNWRTTYLDNVSSLRNALVPLINTNLTVQLNGQALTSDFVVVSTTNVPVPTLVVRDQLPPRGWKDLGEHTFNAVEGEYVELTRINPTTNNSQKSSADALMLSNSTVQLICENTGLGFSTTGTWVAKSTGGYTNGSYVETTQPGATAKWTVSAPSAGVYRVYAYAGIYTANHTDTNVEYRVAPCENRISLALSGLAPQNYTAGVLANGTDCSWNTRSGTWISTNTFTSRDLTLPITVEAVDAEGKVLKSRTFTAIGQRTPATMNGVIASNTLWSGEGGTIVVTGDVIVTSSATLSVASNTVVVFEPSARIVVTNGTLDLQGTSAQPVLFCARSAASTWTTQVSTASGIITGAYARLVGGCLAAGSGAEVDLRDCTLASYAGTNGIVNCSGAGTVHLLRCSVTNFGTTVFQNTPTTIDECLFSGIGICGIDLRNASATATVRQSTVESSTAAAVDGIRFSNCAVGLVSNSLVDTLSGAGMVVSNSGPMVDGLLIYGTYAGVSSSPSGTHRRTTIANTTVGLKNVSIIPQDCIIWSNSVSVTGGPATAAYCDIELAGTNLYPGTANLNRTPWFRDPSENDFRLLPISPCLTAGSNGVAMGAVFPAGATPAAPDGLRITNVTASQAELRWTDNSSDEKWFEIQESPDGAR